MNDQKPYKAIEGNKLAADAFALTLYKSLARNEKFKRFLVDVDASISPINQPSLGRQLESLGYKTSSGNTTWHRSTLANLVIRLRKLGQDLRKIGLESTDINNQEKITSKYLITEARKKDIERYALLVNQLGVSESKAFSFLMSLVNIDSQHPSENLKGHTVKQHRNIENTNLIATRLLAQLESGIPVSTSELKTAFSKEEMQLYYERKRASKDINDQLRECHQGLQPYIDALKKVDRLHGNLSKSESGKDKLAGMYTRACDSLEELLVEKPILTFALDRDYDCGPSKEEVPRSIFSKASHTQKTDRYLTSTAVKAAFLNDLINGKKINKEELLSEEQRLIEMRNSLENLKRKKRNIKIDVSDWNF